MLTYIRGNKKIYDLVFELHDSNGNIIDTNQLKNISQNEELSIKIGLFLENKNIEFSISIQYLGWINESSENCSYNEYNYNGNDFVCN